MTDAKLELGERRDRYSSGWLHEPALTFKRLAVEARDQPIGDQRRRERAKIGRGNTANGMSAVGVDDQLARRGHRVHHALGIRQRAEFVGFAGHHQVRVADFFGVPLQVSVFANSSKFDLSV